MAQNLPPIPFNTPMQRADGTLTEPWSRWFIELRKVIQPGGGAGGVTFPIAIAQGGTGHTTALPAFNALSPLTSKGDILSDNGSGAVRVAVGSDGQVLTADSAQASGVKWGNAGGTAPKSTVITSGSGTHTLTGTPLYIRVRMAGGGGGGAGSGSSAGSAPGSGSATTFGVHTAGGGSAGGWNTGLNAAGGSATIGAGGGGIAITGGAGGPGTAHQTTNLFLPGGPGGSNSFSGGAPGGPPATAGSAGVANTGGGGAGAGVDQSFGSGMVAGEGGGAGGYLDMIVASPAAGYSYGIGSGGSAGGAGGGSGAAGGAGADGVIIVEEFYQ